MRRRGLRGRSRGGGEFRGVDRIGQQSLLGLRNVRSLSRPQGLPEAIELGAATADGGWPVALATGRVPGVELVGWARVAASLLAERGEIAAECIVAAPIVSKAMRQLCEWLSDSGAPYRLVSLPALAERPEALIETELFGRESAYAEDGTLARVVRVIEGAAAVTSAGTVRRTDRGFVLYLRGVRVVSLQPEGDGAVVTFLEPERRQVQVNEANFHRWGLELHDQIVQLAQNPRLLDGPGLERANAVEAAAQGSNVRLTARFLPWDAEGIDPIDWVGVDAEARPVIGLLRETVDLATVPAILAAVERIDRERARFAPGASGPPRVIVSGELADARVARMLEAIDVDIEAVPVDGERVRSATSASERDRGRRRSRRRGRMRDDFREDESALEAAGSDRGGDPEFTSERATGEQSSPSRRSPSDSGGDEATLSGRVGSEEAADGGRGRGRRRRRGRDRDRGRDRELERADAREGIEESAAAGESSSEERSEAQGEGDASRDGRPRRRRRSRADRAARIEAAAAAAVGDSDDAEDDDAVEVEARDGKREPREATAARAADDAEPEDGEEIEIDEEEEEAEEAPVEPIAPEPPRKRRQRAAICVRNEIDSILTAFVLARERRTITFFYVCAQHELMDFFRGKATDIDENTDLLLVGFTAQPVPSEIISAARIYSDQLTWFDHHEWPIEDLEALREVVPPDQVCVLDAAASSLAAVMETAERRSRFTDKLLDLSGARLSENDMAKWGYRLVGLMKRMSRTSGDYRSDLQPILAGKPSELPAVEGVYAAEEGWLEANEPRVVSFGEYLLAVGHLPEEVDPGEIGRRLRLHTGARMSLTSREGDSVVLLGYNEEKRHINVQGLVELLDEKLSWLHARPGGDRIGRLEIDELAQHPERIDALIGEIVRHKSVLYG